MTFGSLFSGIGGIDLGLERAAFECRWQVENDAYATKVLERHWPMVKRYGDIKTVRGTDLEPVDLIAGGFPCQDLSQAGKRAGIEGARSGLWFEFARLIGELRPRYVLIENVPGLLDRRAMPRVIGELARLGYVGCWRCLRASEFGASHIRKRVFIVAYCDGGRERQWPTSEPRGHESHDRISRANGSRMADAEGGGFGELRESSRGDGLINGSNADVADAEDDNRRLGIGATKTGAWTNGERRIGPSSGNGTLADTGNGQLQEPGRGSQGRNGIGPASADVSRFCREYSVCHNPNACDGWSDCWLTRQGLEYPIGFEPEDDDDVSNPSGAGLPDTEQAQLSGARRQDEGRAASELCGAFAPGPSDPRWPAILRERPDLAPALESPLRGVAHELSDWLDRAMQNRTKRLGRLGNAVVPEVVQYIGEVILAFDISGGSERKHPPLNGSEVPQEGARRKRKGNGVER